MALIKCTECGQTVSDKAESCPNCGAPIKGETTKEVKETASPVSVETPKAPTRAKAKPMNKKPLIAVVAAVLVVVVGIGLWLSSGSSEEIVKITPEFAKAVQKYEDLKDFSEGLAAVKGINGRWGFINTKGKEVIPCKYVSVSAFSEGMVAIMDYNKKWGFINVKGKEVVPCKYDDVESFSEGFAKVKMDGKYGFVNAKGEEAVPCKYSEVSDFSNGMAAVKDSNEKWGYVNTKGEEVIRCQYVEITDFSEGLACVSMEDLYQDKEYYPITYINKKGETVIKGYYRFIPHDYGIIIYKLKDGKCFAYDKDHNKIWYDGRGKVVDEPKEWNVFDIKDSQNWRTFWEKGKTGVKDTLGCIIIKAKYSSISNEPSNGVARAILNLETGFLVGYVDKDGNDTFTESDWITFAQHEKNKEEERKREKERQRLAAMKPDWIQGTWTYGSGYGNNKVVISGDNIKVYYDGELGFSGSYVIEDGRIVYDRHNGMASTIGIDYDRQLLMASDTEYFKKGSSSSGGGSSRQPYQFFNSASVLDYLQNKTFYGQGTSVRITFQGVFINGSCMTGAPRVVNYNGYNAVVVATIVGMGQNLTISVDSYNHIITDRATGIQYRLK